MAKALINLWAEDGRNIIDDDATSVLTLESTGAGNALRLQSAAGTGVGLNVVSATTTSIFAVGGTGTEVAHFRSGGTTSNVLRIDEGVIGSSTVAPIVINRASTASGAVFQFSGRAFVSALSGGSITGGIRVKVGDVYHWIPTMVNLGGLGA